MGNENLNTPNSTPSTCGAAYGSAEEGAVAAIWKEILNVPAVRPDDRYLDLGGNSVSLYLIVERIRSDLKVDINPQHFFHPERSRLSDIAALVRQQRGMATI